MKSSRFESRFRETFGGHRLLVAAMIVDGTGTGLFLPFGVVYFLHTTSLSLAEVGAGLSGAAIAALPVPVAIGMLIDRFGPQRVVVVGNLLSAGAFVGYLFVDSQLALVVAAFVASTGQATFWTGTRVLVGLVAGPSRRANWFALQTTTRNVGYGLGAIAGALAVSDGGRTGYLLLAGINAVSYLFAAVLVLRAEVPPSNHAGGAATDAPAPRRGYRRLLTDQGLLLISGVNVVFVLCTSVLSVLLAVYLSQVLDAPVWLGGLLFAMDTVLVIVGQAVITSRMAGRNRSHVLIGAAGAFMVSFALLAVLAHVPRWLVAPGLVLAVAVFAIAGMLQGPIVNALAVDMAPPDGSGKYLAVYQLSWSLGGGMAPALLSGLLTLGDALPWITLIACCAATVPALRSRPLAMHAQAEAVSPS